MLRQVVLGQNPPNLIALLIITFEMNVFEGLICLTIDDIVHFLDIGHIRLIDTESDINLQFILLLNIGCIILSSS
ncbi:unnamed protein product [Gongylonema pulchrum]|uniref:Uncharacterized protein n=1 Tax=Gongylonema pulchrum TaxID=637853 RepID=A0A183EQX4_9BILA|nr:unnamed protein product [Gongylonema pulchrum]